MSAAFFPTCGHGTERMTGSAAGPAKVATRMVLLRMGLFSAPKSNLIRHHWPRLRARSGQPSIVVDARVVARAPSRHARECVRDVSRRTWKVSHGGPSRFLFLLRQHPF